MKRLSPPASILPDRPEDQSVKSVTLEVHTPLEKELASASFAELRERCKAAGLKTTGKKADLVARLRSLEK